MPAPAPCLTSGQMVGNYRVLRPLGEGAMGEVYKVVDITLDRHAALKVVPPSMARDRSLLTRFRREAMAASQVSHPGVVHIFDYGVLTALGLPYFVMEYLEGETLHTRMKREQQQKGVCGGLAYLPILRQIAMALEAVHRRGLVHRDLKPANVMLVPDATMPAGEQAKILDFGIVKILQGPESSPADSQDGTTHQGVVLGTPRYMAPEQWMSGGEITGKTDVYALGVMTFLLLSGELPFAATDAPVMGMMHCFKPAPSLASAAPGTPRILVELVARMLAKEPARRPNMAAVAELLQQPLPRGAAVRPTGSQRTAADAHPPALTDSAEQLSFDDLQLTVDGPDQTQPLAPLSQRATKLVHVLPVEPFYPTLDPPPVEDSLLVGSGDNFKVAGGSSWRTGAAALALLAALLPFSLRMQPSQSSQLQAPPAQAAATTAGPGATAAARPTAHSPGDSGAQPQARSIVTQGAAQDASKCNPKRHRSLKLSCAKARRSAAR